MELIMGLNTKCCAFGIGLERLSLQQSRRSLDTLISNTGKIHRQPRSEGADNLSFPLTFKT